VSDFCEISNDDIHSCQYEYWPSQKRTKETTSASTVDGSRTAVIRARRRKKTWVAIDKRYRVLDENDCNRLAIEWDHEHTS
jgi:hypothetical protein